MSYGSDEFVRLTPKEFTALRGVADNPGATQSVVASTLGTTAAALNYHLQNIYLKLGVRTREDAITKGFELGILQ
jgi:DNA-binding CsgD family transcriptional regulator